MIGRHYVTLLDAVGAVLADISCYVDQVTIAHGRDKSDTQPEASSATLDMAWTISEIGPIPTALEIGTVLRVHTVHAGVSYDRFRGRVTDINYAWDDAGAMTPDHPVSQVVAVGELASLGRRVVGATPWPQQLDGARVGAVLAAAGITPAEVDPGTVQILPRDVDSKPALDVIAGTADSARGVLWERRDGRVAYADSVHRKSAPVALALDACDVLVTPTWKRDLGGLVNKVSIGYGVGVSGGEQPRYTAKNDASIAAYGTYDYALTTELAAAADATALGELLLVRNATPVWIMAALPVDVWGLDATRTAALLGLDMHALLSLTGLPAVGAAPTTAQLWVEGWTETLTFDSHDLELWVSGYCRTAPAPLWDTVDPAWTWDSMGALTWNDATCLGPPATFGRWSDVPATLRWDTVDAAITWDTWKG